MKSDIEIAHANEMGHIRNVAERLHIAEDDLEMYGKFKAKLPISMIDESKVSQNNLVLVTALRWLWRPCRPSHSRFISCAMARDR